MPGLQTGQIESEGERTLYRQHQLPFYLFTFITEFLDSSVAPVSLWNSRTKLCPWGNPVQVPNSSDHVLIFQSLWECKECPPVAPAHGLFCWCSKHLSTADQNSSFQESKPNEAFNSLQTYRLLTSIWVIYLTLAIPHTVWSWENYLTWVGHSFLPYKIGLIIVPLSLSC